MNRKKRHAPSLVYLLMGVFFLILAGLSLLSNSTRVPTNPLATPDDLDVYPLYADAVIPYNIAPLNFHIQNEAYEYITRVSSINGKPIVVKGKVVQWDEKKWKRLLDANKGQPLLFDVYVKRDGVWFQFPTLKNLVAPEPIDPYIVYRLIQPLYTAYEDMSINQRSLESFKVKRLYDNRKISSERSGQCVNCHAFQQYNQRGVMQLHFRGDYGGTVFVDGKKLTKVNTKAEGLPAGAVYPAWHPTLPLVAYSINKIGQDFHTKDLQKTEVMDSESDLILYRVDNNVVVPLGTTPNWLETFPTWSPDGQYLYYAIAAFDTAGFYVDQFKDIHYNLVRRAFNQTDYSLGEADTVLNAAQFGKSAAFPRLSPDGRYLLFSMADYGNFHIWHKTSDLYLMNLTTWQWRKLEAVNSQDVESYHSWSSNGRWILFSSRRDDGSYTRLYIAYFDQDGIAHKPFVLPQRYPLNDKQLFKSYNVPEFITHPATARQHRFMKALKEDPVQADLTN